MQLTVSYSTQLRRVTGTASETVAVTGAATIADVLASVAAKHPDLRRFLYAPGSNVPTILAFLDDEQVTFARPPALKDGSTLTLLTPIAGGSDGRGAHQPLTPEELATYEWQINTPSFGPEGQRKLKAASVMVSRVGGVGSAAAIYLAAAGVGRLVLAHGGNLKAPDLNRQILQTHDHIGKPRIESIVRRLRDLNPRLHIEHVAENVSDANAERLAGQADLLIDAAPLFAERFAMNRAAVKLRRPLIEAAMFDLEAQLLTILPGQTACLACLYPADPPAWKRQFPVFGAVAGTIGAMAALEAIKLLTGLHGGPALAGQLLTCDLGVLTFRKLKLARNPVCQTCGHLV